MEQSAAAQVSCGALPSFRTPRLRLRPRRPEDLDACLALDREPGTTAFIDGPWAGPAAHRAFIASRIAGPYPPGLGYWVVSPARAPALFLGWVLLIPVDAIGPEIEIGWRLIRAIRGQGLAVEAAAPLLAHAARLGIGQVEAEIHAPNLPSRRTAERLGMRAAEPASTAQPQKGRLTYRIALTRQAAS
ncbi:MAG: GNAT family N-acetyltransferase [Pseudomonadota bacterium]